MAENLSEAKELHQRALEYDRWPSENLEEKLAMMTVAINCLERAWKKAAAFPPIDQVLFLKKDIEYALKRIHRQRAYHLRDKLRDKNAISYFEDYAAMLDSICASQKPLSHFCLVKNELKKWNALPFDFSGAVSLTASQQFKLRWKVFRKLFVIIRLRG